MLHAYSVWDPSSEAKDLRVELENRHHIIRVCSLPPPSPGLKSEEESGVLLRNVTNVFPDDVAHIA
jgi:hypothetical protein